VARFQVGYSYSTNAGLTWSVSKLLDSTLLPNLQKNSDPVVTVDTAGNFYIAVIAIPTTGSANLTLAVYKSTDGGVNFPQAFICAQTGSEDKEWITTDLSLVSPFLNTLYISWTRFSSITGIKLTKSTNGGVNWSTPVAVSDVTNGVQGSFICTSPNGQVNVTWLNFGGNAGVMFDKSTDGGVTFGTDKTISTGAFPQGLPNDVNTFPTICSDASGVLYVAFADNRNGDCDVFFTKSTNAGDNWSTPLRVNNDALSNGKVQYWPCIAVNEAGKIVILFMDTRNTPDNTVIEAFVARSTDGGMTFTNELVSSDQSTTNIPGSNVRFGDYIDIDYVGANVVPVWTDERAGGVNMDIFTSEITDVLAADPVTGNVPTEFSLSQNYPNPFNPSTTISFALPEDSYINLELYNSLGQLLKVIAKGEFSRGIHKINFSAGSLPSGVYFYKLITGGFTETRSMILIK
jgi:Secretion system C-terminal sorting domain